MLQLDGKVQQGSADDGEFFCDLQIRDVLKEKRAVNIVVFVTHEYKGIHIGKVCFRLVREAVEEVLTRIDCQIQPLPQRPPRSRSDEQESVD